MSRFSAKLTEYVESRPNFGRLEDANRVGEASFQGHAPFVTLYLRVEDNCVREVRYEAVGCGVTIGAAAALSELAIGRTLEECARFGVEDVLCQSALHNQPVIGASKPASGCV